MLARSVQYNSCGLPGGEGGGRQPHPCLRGGAPRLGRRVSGRPGLVRRSDRPGPDRSHIHLAPPGVQSSREEDEDQGHRPQGLGEPGVVEVDASRSVGSGEHPYHQEEEEGRHPQLGGRLAGDDAQKQQHRHSQEEVLEGYHRSLKVSDYVDISLSVMGIESSGGVVGLPGGEGGGHAKIGPTNPDRIGSICTESREWFGESFWGVAGIEF